jgi:Protein of unknown function (DUF3429)
MTSSSPLPDGSPPSDARNSQPPAWAWILGLAGLIPFVMCAAMQWYGPPGWRMLAGLALLSYGAVIVSFLGGIHWGLAMRASPVPTPRLIWGVMPSLLGWSAVLLDSPWGPGVLALSLLVCFAVDRSVYRTLGLSAWLPLRATLTLVATASVVLGALAYWWA